MSTTEDEPTTHFRTCPLCEATCGLEITMMGDRIQRIRGDRDDVFSKGFICPKGSTLRQLHEDPDRLRRPLVRRDGELVEATWDEAFAAVAEGLGRVWADGDRNAVALYLGNPNAHTIAGAVFARPLIQALGTRNLFSASTVDQMPKHVACGYLFGNPGAIPIPDLDRTDYLLMLGANPLESNGSLCTAPDFPGRMAAIRERGGRIVVVDPRSTRSAAAADEHLPIRAGTDALWLAALAQVIVTEGLDRPGDLAPLLDGYDGLPALLAPFTPEAVEAHCRIAAATTRRIAAELASSRTAVVYGRIGTTTVRFGTVASWLVDVLNVVTGNLDRPGGAMFPRSAHGRPTAGREPGGRGFRTGRWTSRVSGRPEVRGELPTGVLAEEIETGGPGRVRALVTVGGNPVRSIQESDRLQRAVESLEFMVSVDIYVNETTGLADVILPPPSPLEKAHYDFAFADLAVRNVANYSPPILPHDGPDECEILARLALIAAGAGPGGDPREVLALMTADVAAKAVTAPGSPVHGRDPAEVVDELGDLPLAETMVALTVGTGPYGIGFDDLVANPHGIDLGPMTPRLAEVLRTVSGKVELTAAPVVEDLDRLAEVLANPPAGGLLLVGRRHLRSNNSWMHNLEVLVKGRERCTLQVHPDDAESLDLRDGGRATITSAVGCTTAPVEVTDTVSPGTVSLPHGWGHDSPAARLTVARAHAGVNSNVLTDAAVLDPLSGNAQLNAIPVTVAPA